MIKRGKRKSCSCVLCYPVLKKTKVNETKLEKILIPEFPSTNIAAESENKFKYNYPNRQPNHRIRSWKKIQTKSGRKSKEKNWGWEYLVDGGADELATEDNVTEQDAEIAAGLRVLGLFVEHETSYRHQVRLESVRRVIHLLLYSLLISFFLYVPKVARFEERWIRMAGLARDKNLGKRRRWAYLVSREVSRDTSRAWREGVSEWWSRMGADNAFRLLPRSDLAVIRSSSPSLSLCMSCSPSRTTQRYG